MHTLHIANTFFEWELEKNPKCRLSEAFHQHAIFRQLQFLPFLYADPNEKVLLIDEPGPEYQGRVPYMLSNSSFPPGIEIESWGPSQLIAEFASKHKLSYSIPDWELVKQINSKRFSFECSPKLPNATLIETHAQAKQWLASFEGEKVLKSCYGVSGKGHLLLHSTPLKQIEIFLEREFRQGLSVIAEPWVKRLLDFSTQWLIGKDGKVNYLGSTICENDSRGHYRSNSVGNEAELFGKYLPFLKEHEKIVFPIVSKIAQLRYFGNLGIDAMIYALSEGPPILHPIVEINARKTMGWAALMVQQKQYPEASLQFSFASSSEGLLPQAAISATGKVTRFKRNLKMTISPSQTFRDESG